LCYFSFFERLHPEGIPVKNKKLLFLLLLFLTLGLCAGETKAETPSRDGSRPKPKAGRAFIEIGINLAVSTINYWNKYSQFIEDWQFTLTWKDQKRKFFTSEGLRLDSNNMGLNWTHAWAGALYYNWARTNRFSPLGSFLFSFGGSLFWEYFAEWREVASINDMVFTSVGGPAIGEPLFQIASHFRSRPGWHNRLAMVLVNPLMALNELLDGKHRLPSAPGPGWKDFRASLGYQHGPVSPASGTSAHSALNIDLRLVTLPGYGSPGSGSGYARLPIDNEYHIAPHFLPHLIDEMALSTRSVISGWWWKDVHEDKDGGLRGSEFWLGPVMGWEFFQKRPVVEYDGKDLGMTNPWFDREQPTRFTDKHSIIHLIGPAGDWTGYAGTLRARVGIEATLDFGMVNSLAYNDYSADHDVWGVKTTLHNWGYYYSLGYTLGGRLDLRRGAWRAEAGIRYQRFRSIQGLDRFQDDLLDDEPLRDSRFSYNAGLSVAIPRSPLFVSVNLEGIDRWGRFHEVEKKIHELRFYYRLGVRF
jgi:hypothetical protein